MKLLLLILLLPCITRGQFKATWYGPVQQYKLDDTTYLQNHVPKYDTIGPVWRLVSDTTKGWNPASAMQVYEVREYEKMGFNLNLRTNEQEAVWINPKTLKWLDSRNKPLTFKVWEDKQ